MEQQMNMESAVKEVLDIDSKCRAIVDEASLHREKLNEEADKKLAVIGENIKTSADKKISDVREKEKALLDGQLAKINSEHKARMEKLRMLEANKLDSWSELVFERTLTD